MNLPAEFVSNIRGVFRERGDTFLEALPQFNEEASSRWHLTNVESVPTLSYNYVAFADRGEEKVVLKMGVPNNEMLSEMEALSLFDGEGACKLLDCDDERYWMLLERLCPGEMLATMEDDDAATHIAAEVMKRIWRRSDDGISAQNRFIKLSDWFEGLKRLRPYFNGGTGPIKAKILERVKESVADLLAEDHHPVLMHGDFHHYNILSSERGWLIIDPKGVMGPACYEVGPLLINPWGDLMNAPDLEQITKRRIDILHEHLGFERERIHAWGLAHSVLSAWWSIDENTGWEYAVAFSEMMAGLRI